MAHTGSLWADPGRLAPPLKQKGKSEKKRGTDSVYLPYGTPSLSLAIPLSRLSSFFPPPSFHNILSPSRLLHSFPNLHMPHGTENA